MAKADGGGWILIPFYKNPNAFDYANAVDRFAEFTRKARHWTNSKVAVVDDGSHLKQEQFRETVDVLVSNTLNRGKSDAVRKGLRVLLGKEINAKYIVQYDGDGDQSVVDFPEFEGKLWEASNNNPNNPVLLIGNRYSEELVEPPNTLSIPYRQSLLMLFGAIAKQMGYSVMDWVSGARGYTEGYARRFLERSRSQNYGLEAEQLILAFLEKAKVETVPLLISRPRDPYTDTSKWIQNFASFMLHEDDLRERGLGNIVDLSQKLIGNLQDGIDSFDLDLASLGVNTRIRFQKEGNGYSALIPREDRAKIFYSGDHPFDTRKESLRL